MTKPSSSARTQGRFIPREELGEVTQWRFGAVGDPFGPVVPDVAELPSPQEESQNQYALDEALAQAFAQGEAKGQSETALQWQQKLDDYIAGEGGEAARHMDTLARNFERGLMQAQKDMAQSVLALACEVARQVVRRELQADPQALLAVVNEALDALVQDSQPCVVRLHPDDEARLGDTLRANAGDRLVQWIADRDVQPGGCQIEQNGKRIDGSLQSRWQRALAPLGVESDWATEDVHGS